MSSNWGNVPRRYITQQYNKLDTNEKPEIQNTNE